MARSGDPSTSSSYPPMNLTKEKPIVVRVKRKASQACLDAFWLEINERPSKRALLDLGKLSISDSTAAEEAPEEARPKKLLVQHVETVQHSQAIEDVLHSFLHPDSSGLKERISKTKEWHEKIKQDTKQDQLRSTAIQEHADLARHARFTQIWKKRKGGKDDGEDSLREICHLYDVVQEDHVAEKPQKEPRIPPTFEEDAILCNYLPLIREYLPTAAAEIESDISSVHFEDDHIYDIYTVMDGGDTEMEDTTNAYPVLQLDDDDDENCGGPDSDYDTDDSNDEFNPLNDYPDEEPSEDEDKESLDPFDDLQGSDSQCENEEVEVEDEEEVW